MNSKHLSVLSAVTGLATFAVLGQGQFLAANFNVGEFSGPPFAAPVLGQDGITPVSGDDYSVQFYAGPAGTPDDGLTAVGPVLGVFAPRGFLYPPARVTVPGVPAGSRARLQLRAWNNEGGARPTWADAVVRGASKSFDSSPLGRTNASDFALPLPTGLTPVPLLPSNVERRAAPGKISQLFNNGSYASFGFTPPAYSFQALAGDGRTFCYDLVPGSNSGPLAGPVLVNRHRYGNFTLPLSPLPVPAQAREWAAVALSADGSRLVANRTSSSVSGPFLIRNKVLTPLPGALALDLSGNGQFVLLRGPAGEVLRLDWQLGHTVELQPAGPVKGQESFGLSHDGRTALIGNRVWRETGDPIPLPNNFLGRRISGDGSTVVGQADNRPAHWTATSGLVVLHAGEPGAFGQLNDCSFDGSILAGWAVASGRWLNVWTRAGAAYRLVDLLPNGGIPSSTSFSNFQVVRLSHDGRTACFTGHYFYPAFPGGVTPTDALFAGDLVFPEDGARVVLAPSAGANGAGQIALPAPKGFRFQLEHSAGLSGWIPVGGPIAGNDSDLLFDLPAGGDTGFFRVESSPE